MASAQGRVTNNVYMVKGMLPNSVYMVKGLLPNSVYMVKGVLPNSVYMVKGVLPDFFTYLNKQGHKTKGESLSGENNKHLNKTSSF